jgi:DNA mismatch endonuclease (patch repair protein)
MSAPPAVARRWQPCPPASSPSVAARMSRVRTSDTGPEIRLRRLLHAGGLRYRVNIRPTGEVRSYPDVVFTRAKVAVFVDGCFWHGCPDHPIWPKANADWWRDKIEQTLRRDSEVTHLLTNAGWHVVSSAPTNSTTTDHRHGWGTARPESNLDPADVEARSFGRWPARSRPPPRT